VIKYAAVDGDCPAGCVSEETQYEYEDNPPGWVPTLTTTYTWNYNRQMTSKTTPDGVTVTYVYEELAPFRLLEEMRNGPLTGGETQAAGAPGNGYDGVSTQYEYLATGPLAGRDLPAAITVQTSTDEAGYATVRRMEFSYLDNGAMAARVVKDSQGNVARGESWSYYSETELTTLGLSASLTLVKDYTVCGPSGGSYATRFAPNADGMPVTVTKSPGSLSLATYLSYYVDGRMESAAVEMDGAPDIVTDFGYDTKGRLYAIRDPLGNVAYREFDGAGNVVATLGARTDLGAPGFDRVEYTYDTMDNLLNVMRGTASAPGYDTVGLTRSFDRGGNLLSETSRSGITTTFAYDVHDRIAQSVTLARTGSTDSALSRAFGYDDVARMVEATASVGGTTTATVTSWATGSGQPWYIERPADADDPTGCGTDLSYDPLGRLIRRIDGEGNIVDYAYDALDRLIEERWTAASDGKLMRYRAYDYNALGQALAVYEDMAGEDPARATEYTYDAAGRLVEIEGPAVEAGSIRRHETLVYDNASRLVDHYTWRDGTGDDLARTHTSYDANGRVLTLTTPDLTTFWFEYNEAGMRTAALRSTEPCGVADIAGYPLSDSTMTHRTEYRYNVRSELDRKLVEAVNGQTVVDAHDVSRSYHVFEYTYDQDGHLAALTDAAGRTWGLAYDNADRVVEQTVAYCSPQTQLRYRTFAYSVSPYAGSTQTPQAYCKTMTVRTDFPDNVSPSSPAVTRYHYDGRGNLRCTEEGWNGTTALRTTWTTVTDNDLPGTATVGAFRSAYQYQFDRLVSAKFGQASQPNNPAITLDRAYDLPGDLTAATAGSQAVGLSYDANHRLRAATGSTLADGTSPEVAYTDYPGGLSLRRVKTSAQALTYYYSQADFGTSPGGSVDFVGAELSGGQWQFPYLAELRDTAGSPMAVDRARGTSHNLYQSYEREANGNLREDWLYTGGFSWKMLLDAGDTADYDAQDRLAQADAALFTPGSAAPLTPVSTGYAYAEPFGYLLSDGIATYSYDDYGNRLSRTTTGGTEAYSYAVGTNNDPLQRLQSVTAGGVTTTFTYDERGNLASRVAGSATTVAFTWDDANRLTRVDLAAVAGGSNARRVEFAYDPLGRRVRRQLSLETAPSTWTITEDVSTIYDGALPVAEFDGAGNVLREMVWDPSAAGGIGGLVLLRSYLGDDPESGDRLYGEFRPICDRRGNVVALFDEFGALAEFYTYDGFGRTAIWAPDGSALAQSAVGNTFLFSSKLFDAATGLYDFNARWYDPVLGRFLSPDPLGFVDGPNPYAYCAGDPVNFVDPWGLCAEGGFYRSEAPFGPFGYYYPNRPTWSNGPLADLNNGIAGLANLALSPTEPWRRFDRYAYENWDLYERAADWAASDEALFFYFAAPASGAGMAWRNAGYLAENASALARAGWATMAWTSGTRLGTVRVRHYTDIAGITGIRSDGAVRASSTMRGAGTGRAGVHVEVEPFGPASSAADEMGAVKGGAYVEFDAPDGMIPTRRIGPRNTALIPTEAPLQLEGRNPVFAEPRPWWKFWGE
jgi:RHS repeat-associated protein